MSEQTKFDLVVIGSGPGGQKAAIQGSKLGASVLLVERDSSLGGECVHRGTIPSKTLRESAIAMQRAKNLGLFSRHADGELVEVSSLMRRQNVVLNGHEQYIENQVERNKITVWRGQGRFRTPWELEVTDVDGTVRRALARWVVLATGSRPRTPPNVPIDHENLLDSDSILSMIYLPSSLIVLGSGVIACEYASIFAALGTQVSLIDKSARPLAFMEPELTERFQRHFERQGSRFLGGRQVQAVEFDGLSQVETTLSDGTVLRSEKLLCAQGRVANVSGLDLEAAGLATNERGYIPVDGNCCTSVGHIYAVGDVIGPPALAASSMEQGRRAVRHALGVALESHEFTTPAGIYTIPEMSAIGLTEEQAKKEHGGALVGYARFDELARGQINGDRDGLLKLVATPDGARLVGVHAIGESACELVHLGELAMVANLPVETFVEHIFNFPTYAEGYRVAAFDLLSRRASGQVTAVEALTQDKV